LGQETSAPRSSSRLCKSTLLFPVAADTPSRRHGVSLSRQTITLVVSKNTTSTLWLNKSWSCQNNSRSSAFRTSANPNRFYHPQPLAELRQTTQQPIQFARRHQRIAPCRTHLAALPAVRNRTHTGLATGTFCPVRSSAPVSRLIRNTTTLSPS